MVSFEILTIHVQVRAGRHDEVLPMVYTQSEIVRGGKCMPICAELAICNQSNIAIRLAMYCAFRDYDKEMNDAEQLVQNRMPYVQWLVEHCTQQLTPEEVALRSQRGKATGLVEAARRDAEEWARQVAEDLPNALRNEMSEAPVGSLYSFNMLTVERLAALCSIAHPVLALNSAKVCCMLLGSMVGDGVMRCNEAQSGRKHGHSN